MKGTLSQATRLVVLFYAMMFGLAAAVAWWRAYLPGWFASHTPLQDLGLGVSTGLVVVAISQCGMRFRAMRALTSEVASLLEGLTLRQAILFALLSGFGDEALFRGTLQTEFGLVVATLLFAALHIGPRKSYLWWTLFALIVGLGMGLMYAWRGNLLAPIAAHATINALNLHYLSRWQAGPVAVSSEPTASRSLPEESMPDANDI